MRVARAELVRVEPGAGLAGGDHSVAVRQQFVQALQTLGRAKVERHALLAGVAHCKEEAGATAVAGTAVQRREPAGAGPFGRLDLDDLGAEVAQQAATEFAAVDGEVNDAISGEWSDHRLMVPRARPGGSGGKAEAAPLGAGPDRSRERGL